MTRQNDFPDFDEAIASVRNSDPDPRQMGAAGDRVWQRIQAAYADPHFTRAAETLRACQQFRELMPESEAGTLSAGKAQENGLQNVFRVAHSAGHTISGFQH